MAYISMHWGLLYLTAIMAGATRKVLTLRLSNTMDAGFCVAALGEALSRHCKPEIFNMDQGCHLTSSAFTSVLRETEVRISMDDRGRWMDNVFIERLWWSLKYEYVYLHAFETGSDLRAGLGWGSPITITQRPTLGWPGETRRRLMGGSAHRAMNPNSAPSGGRHRQATGPVPVDPRADQPHRPASIDRTPSFVPASCNAGRLDDGEANGEHRQTARIGER
ncbi:transposase InsO family protein [Endobacter medicaginis]|uniref:Transposase InsO family protein n=1 Tax=Endobacter medicaginis TaxID=1181271 RepID=A0A839V753_9PROT|nr:transposase InsO family protein [Endobacter medicaginis]